MSKQAPPEATLFLKNTRDYDQVKRSGQRVQGPLFNLMFCQNTIPGSRVGIVVGRRFGNAVKRNRAKRIFREMVRAIKEELVKGYDIVVFPKTRVLDHKFQTVQESWRVALHRSGVLRPSPYQSCPEPYSG